MANPFVEFKNHYAGQDTVADKLSAAAMAQMESSYEALYNAIYKELSMARKDVNYATWAKQSQLLKQVGIELDKFKSKTGSHLLKALKQISAHGTKVSIKDLETLYTGTTKAEDWHYDYNRKYAEQVFNDNFTHVAAQTNNIKDSVKAQLRTDAALIMRRAAVEGWTRKKAQKELQAQIDKTMPSFMFTDKAGKNWNTKNYFSMLTHTLMSNTLREVYANTLINEGHDLVKITQNGATDACKNWEGAVISLTGADPAYPSMADVKATKEIFHPRCRHRFVAYDPDIDDVFKQVEQGGSDSETLGFDLDEYLSSSPKEKALERLDKLPTDAKTGKLLNPIGMVHGKTKNGMALTEDLIKKHGIDVPFDKSRIPIDSIKASYPFVDKELAKKYIENPAGIGGGMAINATKINGKYVIANGQMKVLAAKLLGAKHVDLTVQDYDKAYKQGKALDKKALTAAKAKEQAKAKAEAEKAAQAAKTKPKPKKDSIVFKESDFERIGPQQGSNPGGLFMHKATGKKYYIKIPKGDDNELKVANEKAAAALYKLAGIEVPKLHRMTMKNGDKAIVSEWADDLRQPQINLASIRKQFQKGFGMDAWLANWDVVGLEYDNIGWIGGGVQKGRPFRIDVGGSLLFRAMGGRKSGAFGKDVGELTTLLNSKTNPQSAKVFGGMSREDLISSLKTVVSIKSKDIEATLSGAGFEGYEKDKLLEILLARQAFIKKQIAKLEGPAPKAVGGIHDKFTWAHGEPTAKDIQAFNLKWSKDGAKYQSQLNKLKKLAPGLTDEEAMALVLYTNGHYGELNAKLRTREEEIANVTTFSAFSRLLNSAIRKATKAKKLAVKGKATGPWEGAKAQYYERKTTIHGSGLEAFIGKYKKGKKTYIDSFLSTSRTRTSFSGNVHIYFKPKTGYAYCDEFSCHRGEDEVVVPVGVKVEVEHVMSDQYGNTIVYLKEI